jgi:hypothetical protein
VLVFGQESRLEWYFARAAEGRMPVDRCGLRCHYWLGFNKNM